MTQHVTHYLTDSGFDDDWNAGCHIETYERHSGSWAQVTCKFCLKNQQRWLAILERERSQHQGEEHVASV